MPRPEHFGRPNEPERLALPRPEASAAAGGYCRLLSSNRRAVDGSGSAEQLDGPLAFGDYGYVLEDTGEAGRPYRVQELESGHIWWYKEQLLQSVDEQQVPEQLRNPKPAEDGDYVTLVPAYQQHSDAGRGPLSLQRTDNAFGLAIIASGSRLRVRACHPAGERAEWWYDREAVRKVHINYVPEHLRQAVRPGWGDYCVLSSDAAEYGGAAEGPLQEGNLGVVVGVDHRGDAEGGLKHTRYVVRACHNGLVHRYHEGAVHPVVLQLLHDEKIPPANPADRLEKLGITLTLMEVPAADGSAAVEVGRVFSRRSMPCGSGELIDLCCPVVVPGKRYWVKATLLCKDDDLMLASLKPVTWELYAPCGAAGQYRPLNPVPYSRCAAAQRAGRPPCLTDSGQHQQHLCPEALSLDDCRTHTRDMRWGDDAGGGGALAHAAWQGSCAGLGVAGGRLCEACEGPWYLPYEDQLLGVFEWDSRDTPLVLTPGGLTTVSLAYEVVFADWRSGGISSAFTTTTWPLQTTSNSADIAAALTEAASSSSSSAQLWQQPRPLVYLGDVLRKPGGRGHSSSALGGAAPPQGDNQDRPAGRAGSSSSSSSEAGEQEATEDEEEQQEEVEGADSGDAHSEGWHWEPAAEGEEGLLVGEGELADGHSAAAGSPAADTAALAAAAAAAADNSAAVGFGQGVAAGSCSVGSSSVSGALSSQPEQQQQQQQHPQQQQQHEGDGVASLPPQLISTLSCSDWVPGLQQPTPAAAAGDAAHSSSDTATVAGAAAAAAAAAVTIVGPASAPTTPLAAAATAPATALAAAAEGDARGRRRSSSSGSSSSTGVCGSTSPRSSVGRLRPRSLSCDGHRRQITSGSSTISTSSSRALAGVAFASFPAAAVTASSSGGSTPTAAGAPGSDGSMLAATPAETDDSVAAAAAAQAATEGVSTGSPAATAAAAGAAAALPAVAAALQAAGSSTAVGSSSTEGAAAAAAEPVSITPAAARRDDTPTAVAAGPTTSSSSSTITNVLTSSTPAAAAAAVGVASSEPARRPRTSPPVPPVLGRGSVSSRDGASSSGSERSGRTASTTPTTSSSSRRAGRGSSSPRIGGGAAGRRSTPATRAGSGSGTPTSQTSSSRPLTPTSAAGGASSRGANTPMHQQRQRQQQQQQLVLGPGLSSISEVMGQLERQAEAGQPFWAEGTDAAADLAAKAYEAAVEWHQAWRRPGRI